MTRNQPVPRPSPSHAGPSHDGSPAPSVDGGHDPFTTLAAVIALAPRQCRWPDGVPGQPGFRFCGARTAVGESYCAVHLHRSLHRLERQTPGALRRLDRARRAAAEAGDQPDGPADPVAAAPAGPGPLFPWAPRHRDAAAPAPRPRLARGALQRQLFDFLRRQPRDVELAPAREIARHLGLKPETVRGQLSRFEARGWIRRRPFRLLHDPTVPD